jgi:hypothetical protein
MQILEGGGGSVVTCAVSSEAEAVGRDNSNGRSCNFELVIASKVKLGKTTEGKESKRNLPDVIPNTTLGL